ncbi:uncharacterized protein LOC126412182 [Schistocerca serialis cubense]|uniref:uncharacterized protein LOC126412182 n=1 Tax=Schistocerca serialis cubense TaxID=2023355 RepID=UPI00214F4DBC|nr:uncharacterized protein LOC126412182 [Schistocerca serialis cubense]
MAYNIKDSNRSPSRASADCSVSLRAAGLLSGFVAFPLAAPTLGRSRLCTPSPVAPSSPLPAHMDMDPSSLDDPTPHGPECTDITSIANYLREPPWTLHLLANLKTCPVCERCQKFLRGCSYGRCQLRAPGYTLSNNAHPFPFHLPTSSKDVHQFEEGGETPESTAPKVISHIRNTCSATAVWVGSRNYTKVCQGLQLTTHGHHECG